MKINQEGCYTPHTDALNDIFKTLDEIIKETSSKVSIGIDCHANNYYHDQTKKYEMDGFKKPPEADELIDFYIKFCHDHPNISYLEDPIADEDLEGWKKLYAKFEEKNVNVTISAKSIIGSSVDKLVSLTKQVEADENLDGNKKGKIKKKKEENNNNNIQANNQEKIKFTNVSFKLNEVNNISELIDSFKYVKGSLGSNAGIVLYDNEVESDQADVVEIGFGMRVKMIALHNINNRPERIAKINRYVDMVGDLY